MFLHASFSKLLSYAFAANETEGSFPPSENLYILVFAVQSDVCRWAVAPAGKDHQSPAVCRSCRDDGCHAWSRVDTWLFVALSSARRFILPCCHWTKRALSGLNACVGGSPARGCAVQSVLPALGKERSASSCARGFVSRKAGLVAADCWVLVARVGQMGKLSLPYWHGGLQTTL